MSVNGQQVARVKLYWQCQIGGWLAFGLVQLSPILLYNNDRMRVLRLLYPAILKVALGLAGTHLLHLCIRRQQWLQMTGGHLTLRLGDTNYWFPCGNPMVLSTHLMCSNSHIHIAGGMP